MFNPGSASFAAPASGRHCDYDWRCAPPYPVREYIESDGTHGLRCIDARWFQLTRLDGNKLHVRDPMGESHVTAVGAGFNVDSTTVGAECFQSAALAITRTWHLFVVISRSSIRNACTRSSRVRLSSKPSRNSTWTVVCSVGRMMSCHRSSLPRNGEVMSASRHACGPMSIFRCSLGIITRSCLPFHQSGVRRVSCAVPDWWVTSYKETSLLCFPFPPILAYYNNTVNWFHSNDSPYITYGNIVVQFAQI